MVNLHTQVLSRRVALGVGATQTVLDFNRPGQLWRLSVSELDSVSSLFITVTTGFPNSEEVISFHCGPGSAVEYAGCNSASIRIQAVQGATNLFVQVSPTYDSQFILEQDLAGQNINNAAYVTLGPTGMAPPYMNYVAIMANLPIDVRTVTAGGGVVFEGLAIPTTALLLNQFKFGNHDRIEVRGTAIAPATQLIRGVWYNRR